VDVVTVEEETGRERYQITLPTPEDTIDETLTLVAGVGYAVTVARSGRVTLTGFDVTDGTRRFEAAVEVGAFETANPIDSELWIEVLEREVVVVVQQEGRLALARFSD
jgi:hypothetical protein